MRKAIILTLLSTAGASSVEALSSLDALSMIESGDNDFAVGTVGEVSRFQIRPHIWRHYSQSSDFRNPKAAREIAGRFLSDLEEDFRKRAGRAPTDFDRYVLWNAGATYYARIGFSKARVAKTIRERATRYANLCQLKDDSEQGSAVSLASNSRVTVPSKATGPGEKPRSPSGQPVPGPAPVTAAAQVSSSVPPPVGAQLEFPGLSFQPISTSTAAAPSSPPSRTQQGVLALGGVGLR